MKQQWTAEGEIQKPDPLRDKQKQDSFISAKIQFTADARTIIRRMERLEGCVKELWSIWINKYLQLLRGNSERSLWKIPGVSEIFRNKNGKVSSATIIMARQDLKQPIKYLKKPINYICQLELGSPNTEEQIPKKVSDPNLELEQPN
uniref:DUF5641 domain-containing protein n=1 Tax=Syphacia muris TaxID=451379 RepID=A0A0N5AZ86_9BILA